MPMNDLFGIDIGEIIKKSKPVRKRLCGIYFLIDQGWVVYVGQSRDAEFRISAHSAKQNGQKIYDKYFILHCKKTELDVLERYYINKFLPKYNTDTLTDLQRPPHLRKAHRAPGRPAGVGFVTPLGFFQSLRDAAKAHGITYQGVYYRVKRLSPGWSVFSEVDDLAPPKILKQRGPKPRRAPILPTPCQEPPHEAIQTNTRTDDGEPSNVDHMRRVPRSDCGPVF